MKANSLADRALTAAVISVSILLLLAVAGAFVSVSVWIARIAFM